MGFDVVYLPPIHPIGKTNRKGPNNSLVASPDDPGCPYAIGGEEGGHKAIEPSLGTFEDFEHFRKRAEELGIEIALDIAIQCSPDHPYIKEHPEWYTRNKKGHIISPIADWDDVADLNYENKELRRYMTDMMIYYLMKEEEEKI